MLSTNLLAVALKAEENNERAKSNVSAERGGRVEGERGKEKIDTRNCYSCENSRAGMSAEAF